MARIRILSYLISLLFYSFPFCIDFFLKAKTFLFSIALISREPSKILLTYDGIILESLSFMMGSFLLEGKDINYDVYNRMLPTIFKNKKLNYQTYVKQLDPKIQCKRRKTIW